MSDHTPSRLSSGGLSFLAESQFPVTPGLSSAPHVEPQLSRPWQRRTPDGRSEELPAAEPPRARSGSAALIDHARRTAANIAHGLLNDRDYDPADDADALQGVCFALRSLCGLQSTQLPPAEERELWGTCTLLWVRAWTG